MSSPSLTLEPPVREEINNGSSEDGHFDSLRSLHDSFLVDGKLEQDTHFLKNNQWSFKKLAAEIKKERNEEYIATLFYYGVHNDHRGLIRCIENHEEYGITKDRLFMMLLSASGVSVTHTMIILVMTQAIDMDSFKRLVLIQTCLEHFVKDKAANFVPPQGYERYAHIAQYAILNKDFPEKYKVALWCRLFTIDFDGTLTWIESNKYPISAYSRDHKVTLLNNIANLGKGYAGRILPLIRFHEEEDPVPRSFYIGLFDKDVGAANSTLGANAFRYLHHYPFGLPGINITAEDFGRNKSSERASAMAQFSATFRTKVKEVLVDGRSGPVDCTGMPSDAQSRITIPQSIYKLLFPVKNQLGVRAQVFLFKSVIIRIISDDSVQDQPKTKNAKSRMSSATSLGELALRQIFRLEDWKGFLDGGASTANLNELIEILTVLCNTFGFDTIRRVQTFGVKFNAESIKWLLVMYRLIDNIAYIHRISSVRQIHYIVSRLFACTNNEVTQESSAEIFHSSKHAHRVFPVIINNAAQLKFLCQKLSRFKGFIGPRHRD